MHDEMWEQVFLAQGTLEAEVIRGKLESNEIPAMLQYESVGLVYGLTTGPLAAVRVLVPVALAETARALLEAEDDPADDVS